MELYENKFQIEERSRQRPHNGLMDNGVYQNIYLFLRQFSTQLLSYLILFFFYKIIIYSLAIIHNNRRVQSEYSNAGAAATAIIWIWVCSCKEVGLVVIGKRHSSADKM